MSGGGMIDARTGLEILDRHDCVRRLEDCHFGRLAVIVGDQPLIFPVNYALDVVGSAVVFRVDPGTKLFAATGHRVAFEIDGLDTLEHGGWSVLVVGIATIVESSSDLRRLHDLAVGPYGPGPKAVWVSVRLDAVTGRRIVRP
jgi:nitroimidazol reductase NimA-like FMN-containing flavoprotein (pyridoxamine 5'-phosphate oxidase superfamily)